MTTTNLLEIAPDKVCMDVRISFDSSDYVERRSLEMKQVQRPLWRFISLPGHSPIVYSDGPKLAGLYVWDVLERIEEAPKVRPRTIVNSLRSYRHNLAVNSDYLEKFLARVAEEQAPLIYEIGRLIDTRLQHHECMNVTLATYWMLRTQKELDDLEAEFRLQMRS